MSKYDVLINVLDQIRREAPAGYKRYYPRPDDIEAINQIRARAYIHLFLKVKFGLLDFATRERTITDGTYDGGIDAYHIDKEHKKVLFIQSKFRTSEQNFDSKHMRLDELLSMDVSRVTKGEDTDEQGNKYNGKIKQLQKDIMEVGDIGRYEYEVVLLANIAQTAQSKINRFVGGFSTAVFDYNRTYNELLFPVIEGTYFNHEELSIQLNLSNKTSSSARVTYQVKTSYQDCDITVLFVPTLEIAKTLHKYKNSILKYNPRSYLELANNTVNREIADTILNLSTNEFSLYNNGITMLSYGTAFSESIGKADKAQLIISRPQIINGGQTAFTLSRLYEDALANENADEIFAEKEVLLKVITLNRGATANEDDFLPLIEAISKATNQQTPVDEADRRSNDQIQIEMQKAIYESFGYFYERKRGEYGDGLKAGYLSRSQIIDRDVFIRICKACDADPVSARRSSVKQLFRAGNFSRTLNNVERYKEYFFAYQCLLNLNAVEKNFTKEKNNRYGLINYGSALRYGKFAVITACMKTYQGRFNLEDVSPLVMSLLNRWLDFEAFAVQSGANTDYFEIVVDEETGERTQQVNFDNYYKGRTLRSDLSRFFNYR